MSIERHNLVDSACSILEQAGYEGLTIEVLARRLHMSKSTLYKHFEKKEALVDAVTTWLCETTLAELDAGPTTLHARIAVFARHCGRTPRALLVAPDRLPRRARANLAHVRERFVTVFAAALGPCGDVPSSVIAEGVVAMLEAAAIASSDAGLCREKVIGGLLPCVERGFSATN